MAWTNNDHPWSPPTRGVDPAGQCIVAIVIQQSSQSSSTTYKRRNRMFDDCWTFHTSCIIFKSIDLIITFYIVFDFPFSHVNKTVKMLHEKKIRKDLSVNIWFCFVLREIVARAPSVEDDCERRERGEENRQWSARMEICQCHCCATLQPQYHRHNCGIKKGIKTPRGNRNMTTGAKKGL